MVLLFSGLRRKAQQDYYSYRNDGYLESSMLVGTMAHELAHLKLMGERRVTGDEYDNELLTDLTAVFHGFGIFLGNLPKTG